MLDKRFYRLIYLFIAMALLAGAGDLYAQETRPFQITAKKYDYTPDTIKVNSPSDAPNFTAGDISV